MSGIVAQFNQRQLWDLLKPLGIASAAMIAAIFVTIWLILWIRTRYRDHADPTAVDHKMLLDVGDLHREGDLSEEEYRSIKSRLIERISHSTRDETTSEPCSETDSFSGGRIDGAETEKPVAPRNPSDMN